MKEKIPRYRAYTIDGHLCRSLDSDTLEELNHKVEHHPIECQYQPFFVRDNKKKKWL